MTLQEKFFCPRLGDIVRSYIVSCHVCQLFKNSKILDRPFMQRKYDINQGTMTSISMDIKHMPGLSSGHLYILMNVKLAISWLHPHGNSNISRNLSGYARPSNLCVWYPCKTAMPHQIDLSSRSSIHVTLNTNNVAQLWSQTHNCEPIKP